VITCRNCGQLVADRQAAHCPACGEPLHTCEVMLKTDVVLISDALYTGERTLPDARPGEADTAEEMRFPPPEPDTAPPVRVPSAAQVTVQRHPPQRQVVPAREVHLVVMLGRTLVGEYRFHSGVITLGRDPLQDVVLDNPSVSRLHCKIRVDERADASSRSAPNGARGSARWRAVLEDLNTANGTFVNRREIEHQAELAPGDEIGVGKFSVLFQPSAQRVALLEMRARAPRPQPDEVGETCFLSLSQVHRIERDKAVAQGAHLKVIGADGRTGRRIPLRGGTTVLGRGGDADVRLRGLLVARRHALIVRRGERYRLVHNSGLRPVWVNGRPVRECTLKHQDEIRVGGHAFRFFSSL